MLEKLKNIKLLSVLIIGGVIGAAGFFDALANIKKSEFRPVIKLELTEETKNLLTKLSEETEKLQNNLDKVDLKVIASDIDRYKNERGRLNSQRYEVWKDEQKLGPRPEILKRRQEITEELERYNNLIRENKRQKNRIENKR